MKMRPEWPEIMRKILRCVFVPLVDVESFHDFALVDVVRLLPTDEVDLLQQLLLVEFQFSNHFKALNSKFRQIKACDMLLR